MKINTLKFGEIEINDELIFDFIEPILGYEELSKYTIIDAQADSPFKWLQSTENPGVSFAVTIPVFFEIEYEFNIPEEYTKKLDIKKNEDLLILNIVNIPQNAPQLATINLLGPLVININNKKAVQMVLNSDKFSVKHKLFGGNVPKKNTEKTAKQAK